MLIHFQCDLSEKFALRYAMQRYPIGFREALERVRECRWCVRPNEGFVRQLQAYEATLAQGHTQLSS